MSSLNDPWELIDVKTQYKIAPCFDSSHRRRLCKMFFYIFIALLVLNAFADEDYEYDDCYDELDGNVCRVLKERSACEKPGLKQVAEMCRKSCGLCETKDSSRN
ncbi:hypothetical protein RB195_004222 [Necator americanus]|uniref:ShKT domain-containing protein n=1 Tax=Necator americanus TaxID=51031 RepID=A0ABR1BKH8_NECAM